MSNEEIEKVFLETRAYLQQRFTREEKLQLMIEAISQALKYEFGRQIKLCSLDLHYNFSVEHQKKVLDFLASEKKCIKYEVSKEPVPRELVDISKLEEPFIAEDDFAPHWDLESAKIAEMADEARYFTIEALPNFEKVADELCSNHENFYTMSFNAETGNVFVNGAFVCNFRAGTVPYALFRYLYSGKYKNGEVIPKEEFLHLTGKATQRTFSQIKSDLKISPNIIDVFMKIKNNNLKFFPQVDKFTLTDNERQKFEKALNAVANSNRASWA